MNSETVGFVWNDSIYIAARLQDHGEPYLIQMGLDRLEEIQGLVGFGNVTLSILKELWGQRLRSDGRTNYGTPSPNNWRDIPYELKNVGSDILSIFEQELYAQNKYCTLDWASEQLSTRELTEEEKTSLICYYTWTDDSVEDIARSLMGLDADE